MNTFAARLFKRLALALLPMLLSSCDIVNMSEELTRLSRDSVFGGRLHLDANQDTARIYLTAFRLQPNPSLHSFTDFDRGNYERQYFFVLPPGNYQILAFEDQNANQRYDIAEPAGRVNVSAGPNADEHYDKDITLDTETRFDVDLDVANFAIDKYRPGARHTNGQIISINDSRFNAENARLGLWQPRRFLAEVGGGFYQLAPYDENKTPVVMVHGALGHPGEWKTLISALGTKNYQYFLYYYPTALSLERSSEDLAWYLYQLHHQHRAEELVVIGHSMGGLISMRGIQLLDFHLPSRNPTRMLISLSTPWLGHRGAGLGADYAPVPAPSWVDMAPGSNFLQQLHHYGIPSSIYHALLFSYKGSKTLGEKADGAVTLASQLAPDIQDGASMVYGFNETHRSILQSSATVKKIETLLNDLNTE